MFLERFRSYLQFEKRFSVHTTTAYVTDLQQFQSFLNLTETDFSLASNQDVRAWLVDVLNEGASAATVNRKLSTLRTFYAFLQREKLIDSNPTLLARAPKVSRRLPVFVPENKMNDLLDGEGLFGKDFEGLRDKLVIELLFGTGIRLSELISVLVTDVDFYESAIKVLGKRNKVRIVPVSTPLLGLIKEYLSLRQFFQNLSPELIVTKEGKRAYPKLIYRIVKRYLDYISTSQKKSPHVLRHSFATSLLNNGADLNAIKELLGHASLAATQVYTHNSVEKLKSIYKQAHPRA